MFAYYQKKGGWGAGPLTLPGGIGYQYTYLLTTHARASSTPYTSFDTNAPTHRPEVPHADRVIGELARQYVLSNPQAVREMRLGLTLTALYDAGADSDAPNSQPSEVLRVPQRLLPTLHVASCRPRRCPRRLLCRHCVQRLRLICWQLQAARLLSVA